MPLPPPLPLLFLFPLLLLLAPLVPATWLPNNAHVCGPFSTTPISIPAFKAATQTFHVPQKLEIGTAGACCGGWCVRVEKISHWFSSGQMDSSFTLSVSEFSEAVGRLEECVDVSEEGWVEVFDPKWEGRVVVGFCPDDKELTAKWPRCIGDVMEPDREVWGDLGLDM